jgi:hypothetical protein
VEEDLAIANERERKQGSSDRRPFAQHFSLQSAGSLAGSAFRIAMETQGTAPH